MMGLGPISHSVTAFEWAPFSFWWLKRLFEIDDGNVSRIGSDSAIHFIFSWPSRPLRPTSNPWFLITTINNVLLLGSATLRPSWNGFGGYPRFPNHHYACYIYINAPPNGENRMPANIPAARKLKWAGCVRPGGMRDAEKRATEAVPMPKTGRAFI